MHTKSRKRESALILYMRRHKRFMKRAEERNRPGQPDEANMYIENTYKTSPLMHFLINSKFVNEKSANIKKNKAYIKIPRVFSFTENPDSALEVLKDLCCVLNNRKIRYIEFNHSKCEELGLGASSVMDFIVVDMIKYRERKGLTPLTCEGEYPKVYRAKEMLYVSGLPSHLNAKNNFDPPVPQEYIKKIEYKGGRGYSRLDENTSVSGKVSTKVSQYINECLLTQGYEINPEGLNLISHMVGELINNCELHSGHFKRWVIQGHYSTITDGNYGECNITLFNFGQTIYESIKNTDLTKEIKESFEKITELHRNAGHFNTSWNEETLWTLYALQDGVSRLYSKVPVPEKKLSPDRGTGTIKFLTSFKSIGDTYDGKSCLVSIISGHTYIRIDKNYDLRYHEDINKLIIAFNDKNDLRLPPDKNNVKLLKNYFPGTIISMKFYFDKDYITSVLEESKK